LKDSADLRRSRRRTML